jgi:gamma-glutamyltranspeptidase/glutathione hydrolase
LILLVLLGGTMRPTRLLAVSTAALLPLSLLAGAAPSGAVEPRPPDKNPTAVGTGGAVTSVDPEATRIGLRVLRQGGNAVDAAVATAAALGVTEPYSAGVGGGGYFVHLDGRTGEVSTIDGRETAPSKMPRDAFIDPETGEPYPFTPELVTSGVSVGVPGTLATWETALREWGSRSLRRSLVPAARLARRGFVVDQTFHDQTADNAERFEAFRSSRRLFLPGGEPPEVGSVFENPDLARLYELIARKGTDPFYRGRLAARIAKTTRKPPVVRDTDLPVPAGHMRPRDLRRYRTLQPEPVTADYRGLRVHGMGGSSSGGSTVGEALQILDTFDLESMSETQVLHHLLEASALAFADRAAYLGDREFVDVPDEQLLSETYAAERACLIDPGQAATKPVAAGDVDEADGTCPDGARPRGATAQDTENVETTHLTVADRWGDVVSYTLTIEQTGGSGIVVPGRGFLLNNELTDFSLTYDADDPNRIEPGKRPRSSMSPTIVTEPDGTPVLALGSPGGSTIITTVLQLLVDHLDRGLELPAAVADPRGSQRNTAAVTAEPAFIDAYGEGLRALGHELRPAGDAFTSAAEIGAATAIGFGPGGLLTAVAEPERRGGGDARVLEPRP